MLKRFHKAEQILFLVVVRPLRRHSRLAELIKSQPALGLLVMAQFDSLKYELLPLIESATAYECDLLCEGKLLDHPHSGPVWAPEQLLQALRKDSQIETIIIDDTIQPIKHIVTVSVGVAKLDIDISRRAEYCTHQRYLGLSFLVIFLVNADNVKPNGESLKMRYQAREERMYCWSDVYDGAINSDGFERRCGNRCTPIVRQCAVIWLVDQIYMTQGAHNLIIVLPGFEIKEADLIACGVEWLIAVVGWPLVSFDEKYL